MLIRPARPTDAPAAVALRALVYPYLVRGIESTRKMISEPPPGEEWVAFVAEVEGRMAGWVSAYRNGGAAGAGFGDVSLLHVHPEQRGRGLGSALLARALAHLAPLGVRRVRGWALADSVRFARRHGFEPGRELRYAALDLRPAPPAPSTPDGVRLHMLADLEPRRLHALHAGASADEPGDVPSYDVTSYENWRYEVWENLGLDRRASTAVEVDGTLVAYSLVKRDGDRMWSDMTATLPAYRGRGLARLAKLAALHRAGAAGVTMAYTSNDAANAAMLAINRRLGYRQVAAQWSCLRDLP